VRARADRGAAYLRDTPIRDLHTSAQDGILGKVAMKLIRQMRLAAEGAGVNPADPFRNDGFGARVAGRSKA
jgi:hypothetical protein